MLRTLMDKVDIIQKQLDSNQRNENSKNQKEKLEIKNTVKEMKNPFDEFNRL